MSDDYITVIGLGKVGSPMAAAMAARGLRVIGVDKDPGKVAAIQEGRPPVRETMLGDYIARAGPGNLSATGDAEWAVKKSDAVFIIVPTPSGANDEFVNDYVVATCHEIAPALKEGHRLVVISSTVMPGSIDGPIVAALEHAGAKRGRDFGLCYNPLFIALGNVIKGFLEPDIVLIGAADEDAERLASLHYRFCMNDPAVVITNPVTAEIAKLALNCFLTTKIAFANYIGWLCSAMAGARAGDVAELLGADSRISPKYLRAGAPFGGPCFPRDVRALAAFSANVGVMGCLPTCVSRMNARGMLLIAHTVMENATPDDKVAVLGAAYKVGTHLTEDAPATQVISDLERAGLHVAVHDPMIDTPPAESVIDGARVVVLMLPYQSFAALPFKAGQTVVDCWGILKEAPPGVNVVWIGGEL